MPQLPPSSDFGVTRRVLVSTQKPVIAPRRVHHGRRVRIHDERHQKSGACRCSDTGQMARFLNPKTQAPTLPRKIRHVVEGSGTTTNPIGSDRPVTKEAFIVVPVAVYSLMVPLLKFDTNMSPLPSNAMP